MRYSDQILARFGNVFALDHYTSLFDLDLDFVEQKRYTDVPGNKTVYRYKGAPPEWNFPDFVKVRHPVRIELQPGSYFRPHRDHYNGDFIRLNCHPISSHPEDCTYIIGGEIQHWRPQQWMVMNPSLVHYSINFLENNVHYVTDLLVEDQETREWLISKIPYREGIK